jgi:hypothetical protein
MSHSAASHSFVDLLLVAVAALVVILTFYLAVKYTFWPGEKSTNHIKRRILDDFGRDPP